MNISTETREILRNYRAVINARRREMGQKPLTTAQIIDEICDFVANQQAVFLGGHYILQGSRNRRYRGRRWRPPVSPRENPWQADACRKGSGPRWRVARYPSRL